MKTKLLYAAIVVMIITLGGVSFALYNVLNENNKNVSSSESSSVDSNIVSAEYKNFVLVAADAYTVFLNNEKEDESVDSVKELALDYLTFVSKHRVQPTSSVEFDIDEYFHKFLISSKYASEYYIKYANNKDKTSYSIFKEYKADSIADFELTVNIAESYGIN